MWLCQSIVSCPILMGTLGTILLCYKPYCFGFVARCHFRAPDPAEWQMRSPREEGHDKSRNVWHHSDAPPSPSPSRKTGLGQQMQASGNHRLRAARGFKNIWKRCNMCNIWKLYQPHFLFWGFYAEMGRLPPLSAVLCLVDANIQLWVSIQPQDPPVDVCTIEDFPSAKEKFSPLGPWVQIYFEAPVFPWNLDRTDVNLLS